MKTVKIKDKHGLIHNYNPMFIKDVQEIEDTLGTSTCCLNIILTGEGEHINSILFDSKEEMNAMRDMIISCIESI